METGSLGKCVLYGHVAAEARREERLADHEPWSEDRAQGIIASHAGEEGATLPILHDLQSVFGFIPAEAVPLVADALNLTRAEVHPAALPRRGLSGSGLRIPGSACAFAVEYRLARDDIGWSPDA
jgi:hypothetical protein